MQKDKRKEALESLKQIYLKNREEKSKLARERFPGYFLVEEKQKRKVKKGPAKYYLKKKARNKTVTSLPLVSDRKKFNNYKKI